MIARARRRMPLVALVTALVATSVVGGCSRGDSRIKTFAPPAPGVMPRRLLVARHSEIDTNSNGYIDGVLVSVYFFNYDRTGPGAEQPFHRDGTLRFQLYGEGGEVLCEGQFDPQIMARSADQRDFGPGYALKIDFAPRGYEDVRERFGARMDFEFVPTAEPETRSFGSTQVRLGPMY